ncbi:MAG: redoxin domain-containing protein [Porphyromonadaceae bacterium]|nr:redoxin domain-containing protein [Porphyromonadaceae bacterium]
MSIINSELPEFKVNAYRKDKGFFEVTQEDLKGKWSIFFFYPGDFTFVCPTELADLADHYEEFQKLGVDIYSISTDSHFVHDNGIGRDATELLRKVKAAKFVYEHPGQVCPAKWQEGDATLQPSIDLVGKI